MFSQEPNIKLWREVRRRRRRNIVITRAAELAIRAFDFVLAIVPSITTSRIYCLVVAEIIRVGLRSQVSAFDNQIPTAASLL